MQPNLFSKKIIYFIFFSGILIHEFLKANSLMQFNTLKAKVYCYFETMEFLFAQNVKM